MNITFTKKEILKIMEQLASLEVGAQIAQAEAKQLHDLFYTELFKAHKEATLLNEDKEYD